ncbi:GGDEF domain-containing protein [Ancylobacter lacus]|uniref:GGDEF domain-containing protein n=1 Tax=Ancylobacter lacus TaxID=2579970 RepID=UPI001BCD87D5|nr:GGDEF domain-containing protein [Ancylobacter lacus]MBS7540969.1 GGDEF domain-containing protein [Ancylobacter lacus]
MLIDYSSLLIAIGFSAICLSVILFSSWITARTETFLLTCAAALGLLVLHVFSYSLYIARPVPWLGAFAFSLLLAGLATLHAASRQFRLGASSWSSPLAGGLAIAIVAPPLLAGYDGVGCVLFNLAAATLLAATAAEYWRGRAEAPGAITALAGLHMLAGLSFLPCTVLLVLNGKARLDAPPQNWAEDLNVIIGIIAVPGAGALTLALNQTRLARAHKQEAMTDSLTGLLNRRALFDLVANEPLRGDVAVVLFDIDRFKTINDERGHAAGDQVLACFAQALRERVEQRAQQGPALPPVFARLGGEEFALLLRGAVAESALREAEAVRARFAALVQERLHLGCTASAGIAFGQPNGYDFEATLNAADQMLYGAKRNGRDRVAIASARLVTLLTPTPRPSSHP